MLFHGHGEGWRIHLDPAQSPPTGTRHFSGKYIFLIMEEPYNLG